MNRGMFEQVVVFAILVLGALTVAADEPVVSGPEEVQSPKWLRTPPPKGAMSERDVEARNELLRRLETDQDDEFRQLVKTTIPDRPTGLPAEYDVAIYGSYIGSYRLLVQVRNERAIGEFQTTGGIRSRGELPVELIDRRVRQLAYATMAQYEPLRADDSPIDVGTSSTYLCTHIPFLRIDVVSHSVTAAWRLTTDSRQSCSSQIMFANNGLRGHCHSRLIADVHDFATDHWRDIATEEKFAAESLAELQSLAKRVERLGTMAEKLRQAESSRQDIVDHHALDLQGLERALVDGRILGFRAIDARLRDAAPLLGKIGQVDRAADVRLITGHDEAAVRTALASNDYLTFRVAVKAAAALPAPSNVDHLLESLGQHSEFWRPNVLKSLEPQTMNEQQVGRLRDFAQSLSYSHTDRIAAMKIILLKTDDNSAFQDLRTIASTGDRYDSDSIRGMPIQAIRALVDVSHGTGRRRAEIVELARTWLKQLAKDESPGEALSLLAQALGRFGQADDIRQLTALAEHSNAIVRAAALQGLASLDSKRALELAHLQVTRLMSNPPEEPSLDEIIPHYLDLFFWQRDAAGVQLIQMALDRSKAKQQNPEYWLRQFKVLREYVQASDLDERLNATFGYLRTSQGEFWPRDVIKQLQGEGADPDTCRALVRLLDQR